MSRHQLIKYFGHREGGICLFFVGQCFTRLVITHINIIVYYFILCKSLVDLTGSGI
jgi:hypothetical protein